MLAALSFSFTHMTEDSGVIPAAQQQQIAAALEDDAEVMSNTQLDEQITGQPPEVEAEIVWPSTTTPATSRSRSPCWCRCWPG